jgi:hypothetical protein
MSLGETAPHFALLQDFFPASAGRRAGVFAAGESFTARAFSHLTESNGIPKTLGV